MSIPKSSFLRPFSSLRDLFRSSDQTSAKTTETESEKPTTGDAFESKSTAPDGSATKKLLGDPGTPNLNDAIDESLDYVEGKRKRDLGGRADAGDAAQPNTELGEQDPTLMVEGKRKRDLRDIADAGEAAQSNTELGEEDPILLVEGKRKRTFAELDDQLGLDPSKKTYYA